jgi:hypothetical protein
LRLLLICGVGFGTPPAFASKTRLRLERVDASRCAEEGRIDLFAVEIELEGTLRKRPFNDYRLMLDQRLSSRPPLSARPFSATTVPLALALILQTNDAMTEAMPSIKAGLQALLLRLPSRGRITLIQYADTVHRLLHEQDRGAALRRITTLNPGGVAVDLELVEALLLGFRALGPKTNRERRLLLVVSDGQNRLAKRDLFRNVGNHARHLQIPIHPLAFSPLDDRGPLLNLGEIAKRSQGTFRWAPHPSDIVTELEHLAEEINQQMVLTFAMADRCRQEHRVQLTAEGLRSNVLLVPRHSRDNGLWGMLRRSPWIEVLGTLFLLSLLILGVRIRWRRRKQT